MTPPRFTKAQEAALLWLPADGGWAKFSPPGGFFVMAELEEAGLVRIAELGFALTLRRAPPDNPRDERYAVMVGETYVGAIILAPGARDAPLWTWSISAFPRLREATTSGRADSREEAMADFRAAWDRAGVDLGAWRSHMADVERARKAWERRGKVP